MVAHMTQCICYPCAGLEGLVIKGLAERAGYDLQVRWRSVAAALALCRAWQWVATSDWSLRSPTRVA